MPQFPLYQVDAFTDRPLAGNACAVGFEADQLNDDEMQAIAVEMNLPETSFVRQSSEADFGVRYFTPAEEIPMAGHPTIATTADGKKMTRQLQENLEISNRPLNADER